MKLQNLIPKQIHVPYVGALFELAGRAFFFVSIANFILNTRLFYYNTGDSWLREHFSSYLEFGLAYIALGLVVIILVWVILIPSQNKFQQEQSVKDGRSPMFDKICEIYKQNEAMEKEILDLKNAVEVLKNGRC
jgi:hypothetical protein